MCGFKKRACFFIPNPQPNKIRTHYSKQTMSIIPWKFLGTIATSTAIATYLMSAPSKVKDLRYRTNWHKFQHYIGSNGVHQGQFVVEIDGNDVPVNGLMCMQCGKIEVDDWPGKATHVSTYKMEMCPDRGWTKDTPSDAD